MKKKEVISKVVKKLAEGYLDTKTKKDLPSFFDSIKKTPLKFGELFNSFCTTRNLDLEQQALILDRVQTQGLHTDNPEMGKQLSNLVKKNPHVKNTPVISPVKVK